MKRIISTLILATLCGISAFAYDFSARFSSGQNQYTLYFNVINLSTGRGAEVTSERSSSPFYSTTSTYPRGNIIIPTTVTYNGITYSVKSIGEHAFSGCSGLTSVTIRNSVTSIGSSAFSGCSGLTSITISESVTSIGNYAFSGCSGLTSITIPESVAEIGKGAFRNCSGLTSVTIPNSVTSIDGPAFEGCSGLTEPLYNDNIFAYFPCDYATECIIPDGITLIAGAFLGCSELTSVTIPNSVTNIGSYAFSGCSGLTSITIPNSVIIIDSYAFNGCSGLTSITIPNSVTSIGSYAFSRCSELTSIEIPNLVTSIGSYAFNACSGLTSITIGNSVTTIGEKAFKSCNGLTSIIIPNSVTEIGNGTFSGCSGLEEITIPFVGSSATATTASASTLLGYIFGTTSYEGGIAVQQYYSSYSKATYYIPSNLRSITVTGSALLYGAFYDCTMLTSVTIGNSVTSIEKYAFYSCSGLTSINIPNSVTSIGESAFCGCSGLIEMTIPFVGGSASATSATVSTLFGYIFGRESYTGGTAVTQSNGYTYYIPSGLRTVSVTGGILFYLAFNGCTMLTSVTIGNSVTSIGNYAFYGCSGLTEVNFYATNCTTMGTSSSEPVFYGCTSFTTLNIGDNVRIIPAIAFYGCSSLSSVTIPNSVTNIGNYAFYGCSGLTEVNFNATNCTMMGSSSYPVFNGCNANATINIGEVVTKIPEYAFFGLNGNGTLTIPNSVTSIGESAFYGSCGLTEVNFNATNCTTMGSSSYPVFNSCNANATINIGEGVFTIPEYAFIGLKGRGTLTIPNSVTSIGCSAFRDCSGISGALTIPNSVVSVADSVFYNCSGLTSVTISNSVTSIGCSAFQDCSSLIGELVIPNSVRSIGVGAFQNCSGLTSIPIGNSVRTIGENAFKNCSGLTSIIIPNSVNQIGCYEGPVFSGCSGLVEMTIPFVGTQSGCSSCGTFGIIFGSSDYEGATPVDQGGWSYYIPSSLRSVTITGGSITLYAFSGCSMLTSVTIPNSVTSICSYAFYGCSGLTEINIPNSIREIGDNAFNGCSGLTEVTIPNYVTSIGESAFRNCSGLTTINFNATNCTTMGFSSYPVFLSCNSNAAINIGGNVRNIPDYAFKGLLGNGALSIPNSVTSIGQSAFYNCRGLTSVTIGNSVTSIGNSAFYGCSGLTSVTIGNSVTNIGNSAFYGCSGMTEVTIPNSVTSIGNSAFYGCSGMTEVTIPNSVTSIGNSAFYGCSELTSVTIPNSVTTIGGSAFSGCGGLEEMTIPFIGSSTSATTASASTLFGYIFGTTSYEGGIAVTQYYASTHDATYYIPSSLKSITVTGGRLLYGAVYNCSMLTSVTIGENVTHIDDKAFYNCSGLTDIYANPTTPPSAFSSSFNNVSVNATVWVPCGAVSAYGSASGWSNFSDIRENFPYTLNVSSADLTMGTASVTQQDCIEGTAIIEANPNRGYAFSQWNDGNTDNPRTVTVTEDVEYTASFVALPAYTITAESADEIRGTVTGGGFFYEGESAILTATANDGYTFGSWTDGNTDNPRTVMVTGDATYTATFKAWRTITVISIDETQGTVSGGGTYLEDAEIEISATPAEHYHFAQWNDGNTDNPRTITVTSDSTFTAVFAIDQHTVTVVSADTEMGTVSEGGTYDYGTEIQISATPADGYGFVAWNGGNIDNPRTVIVTEDTTYTATFGVLRTISVVSADETMGTVEGTGEYVEGATVQITAIPNEHYHFEHWMIEENPTREIITDNPLTITVTGNVTYTAVFAIDQHTITVESSDEVMGTASGSNTYDYGTEIQISATAAEHYHFTQWNDGNTDNPRTITVTGDATYRALFAIDQHTITVESDDETMGTVNGSNTYDYGTEIQISATAAEHYHFVQWNDGNTDNPRTVTITSDTTFTASFAIDQHTITVESGDIAMGTVSEGGTYDYGTEIQISATAAEHYHFVQWSDGNTDNPRTVTITSDTTFTASFAIDQHTITVESDDETMGTVSGSNTYDYGTEIQISAIAAEHYHFTQWNDGNTDNPRTITVVADATYIASFASVTSIEETAAFEIALFPNPTTDILNITSSETISEIEIVNVMGQIVKRMEVNADNVVCDVEELTSGVYVVKIRTEGTVVSQRKFIKE